jgi:hypothetical protein
MGLPLKLLLLVNALVAVCLLSCERDPRKRLDDVVFDSSRDVWSFVDTETGHSYWCENARDRAAAMPDWSR